MILRKSLFAAVAFVAAVGAGPSVDDLSYEELISLVFFEDPNVYQDPTGYFCNFIALEDKEDYCKATMTTIDRKLCKVEVTRELRATYSNGKGREFLKSRDVFALANFDLKKLKEPEIDEKHKTIRQTFETGIDVKWHEGYQYAFVLDGNGKYKSCLIDSVETDMTQSQCEAQGQQPREALRKVSLIFNPDNYNRSIAAIRWLQKTVCPLGDEL